MQLLLLKNYYYCIMKAILKIPCTYDQRLQIIYKKYSQEACLQASDGHIPNNSFKSKLREFQ